MKRMKTFLAVLFSAALLVTMTACSGGTDTQDSSSSTSSSSSAAETESQSTSETAQSPEASEPSQPADSSSSEAPSQDNTEAEGGTLVVYFSATGNTEAVAQTISDTLDADLYEIVPAEPYTDADLNWNDPDSRVNAEHADSTVRPAIAGDLPDLSGYDTVLIGYPLWWREAPPIVWNFVEQESEALAGKTVIPFCTSMSDGIGSSGDTLAAMAPDAEWQPGGRFGESLNAAAVESWLSDLGLLAD